MKKFPAFSNSILYGQAGVSVKQTTGKTDGFQQVLARNKKKRANAPSHKPKKYGKPCMNSSSSFVK